MDKLNYIERLKDTLHSTDYIAIKNSEGLDCSEYDNWKERRQSIRNEINMVNEMTEEEFSVYLYDKEEDNGLQI